MKKVLKEWLPEFVVLVFIAVMLVALHFVPASTAPEDAVVFIDTYSWTGSGVCVDESGIILTAAHVLDDAWNITIRFPDGRRFTPYDIYIDRDRDIAFCRIDPNGMDLPTVPIGDSGSLYVGDEIEIIGHPLGIGWWHSYGRISKVAYNGDIYMDIAGNPGNSGCPVLHSGEIVGILTCGFIGADGLIMGIESDYIKLVLAKYKFFDDVDAQSPFLNFVEWSSGWLLEEPILNK